VLGYDVQLLIPLERRLELLADLGPEEILVVEFTPELARRSPEEFAESVLRAFGARVVVAGEGFRFGAGRRGDLELLAGLGFDVRAVPLVAGVSSSGVRVLVPAYGIYAGRARVPATGGEFRTAVSIGVNPHYGGVERRVEAFLLDFEGDLYGERLRIELWERLREERAFASEADLVGQIARDVEAARAAEPPPAEPE
jgi:riboflavin kinase/FMN adenylyltransferase